MNTPNNDPSRGEMSSADVYNELLRAAGPDPQRANVYFMGDGLTVSLNRRPVSTGVPVSLTLVDEKTGLIVSAAVRPEETDLGDGYIVPFKTVLSSDLTPLTVVKGITPAEHSQIYSWDAAKAASLAAPELPGVDTGTIRGLLSQLSERP